jgi:mRNA interferase MazF
LSAPARGEIWSAQLDPVLGHEQGGTRPCLVLSVNRFNQGKADLVVVLPVTSRFKGIASHVRIPAGEAELNADSYIKCEEVRCISKQRLTRRWGAVEASTMHSVEQFVRAILGL